MHKSSSSSSSSNLKYIELQELNSGEFPDANFSRLTEAVFHLLHHLYLPVIFLKTGHWIQGKDDVYACIMHIT